MKRGVRIRYRDKYVHANDLQKKKTANERKLLSGLDHPDYHQKLAFIKTGKIKASPAQSQVNIGMKWRSGMKARLSLNICSINWLVFIITSSAWQRNFSDPVRNYPSFVGRIALVPADSSAPKQREYWRPSTATAKLLSEFEMLQNAESVPLADEGIPSIRLQIGKSMSHISGSIR